ncbi:MAG TPA: citrate/2-methylcitrate synthase [Turneriella sp.]|nr:citrate/2-methylcitrate synthase [Turneriella sp.]
MALDDHAGLEDIEVLKSSICELNQKELRFRGYSINDLAEKATFEEVVYLLWNDALPSRQELSDFTNALRAEYNLPREIIEHINHVPREAHPMAVLRTLVSSLGLYDEDAANRSVPAQQKKAIKLIAKIPLIVAAIARHRNAKANVEANPELGIAANFLYSLTSAIPDTKTARLIETTLILYAEHELNASTFAARVTAATEADTYSCIVSALSTLQGGLHGGANQRSIEMLLTIANPESVDEYIAPRLTKKEIIMGFGHRVYKNGDPRVPILRTLCESLAKSQNEKKLFQTAKQLEEEMLKRKSLHANVDFYSGLAFYLLGLSADIFTCVFAMARSAGYLAHIAEQWQRNKLIRPRAVYEGKKNLAFVPIDKR